MTLNSTTFYYNLKSVFFFLPNLSDKIGSTETTLVFSKFFSALKAFLCRSGISAGIGNSESIRINQG